DLVSDGVTSAGLSSDEAASTLLAESASASDFTAALSASGFASMLDAANSLAAGALADDDASDIVTAALVAPRASAVRVCVGDACPTVGRSSRLSSEFAGLIAEPASAPLSDFTA